MNPNLSAIAGAPIEVKLGGDTYRLSPLTHGDLAELEEWAQGRIIGVARRAADGLSAEDRRALLGDAAKYAASIDMSSPEAAKLLATAEGSCRMVWLSLRHNHHDLTLEQVKDLLSDPASMDGIMAAVDVVNDLMAKAAAEGKAEPADGRQTPPPSTA